MITLEQCAVFAGLASNETLLGATPSALHHSLLSSYLLNLGKGPKFVRKLIVVDIRTYLDLGASKRAADLLLVLREFLSHHPEARLVRRAADRSAQFQRKTAPRYIQAWAPPSRLICNQ